MVLIKGNTYYKVTFADPNLTMPCIEPLVYIGKNTYYEIEGKDVDTHQFQDTISYQKYGIITEAKNKDDCWVEIFEQEKIGKSLVDLEGAIEILKSSLQLSQKLGEPKLKISNGNWITVKTETLVPINNDNLD